METTRENDETIETTRENDEIMENTRENDETMEAIRENDETMQVGEIRMAGDDGEIRMAGDDGENNMTGDETAGVNQDEVLFEMVNESTFKSLFNNEQDLCEQLPRTIHIMRSLNRKVMFVYPDGIKNNLTSEIWH
ncbi:hypothetical protein TNIN_226271 [Trichonephila inaurata madagascariensis]|uniref:Uncharacterized protein n=1 Tax=Trichonephila inaurata madagascariensis TaxID=2747483 RepID=A0A8X6XWS6_9ARAC|nr:hypothetical protein TNIN_226271 [Trichonephila inaurata madagascariensis]